MSHRSYSRVWLHIVWGTKNREPLLQKPVALQVSAFLKNYAAQHGLYMSINYVNADHVHVLIDLPVNRSTAEVVKLLKGASSHHINRSELLRGKFSWGRGYGVFSVSHSQHSRVARYIAHQKEHHRKRTFTEEYQELVRRYDLQWQND